MLNSAANIQSNVIRFQSMTLVYCPSIMQSAGLVRCFDLKSIGRCSGRP